MRVEYREGIQVAQHDAVLTIGKSIHAVFQSVADFLNRLVALLTEIHMHIVRESSQMLRLSIYLAVFRDAVEQCSHLPIVWVVDNHFLARNMTLGTDSPQLAEEIAISVHIEYHRVVVGLNRQESTNWCQHQGTHPHAHHRRNGSSVCQVVAQGVDDVVEDENNHSHHHWHSQTSLADDGTERCTDKEENKTCQGKRDFLPNLNLVHSLLAPILIHHLHLELHVEIRQIHLLQGTLHHIHALHIREMREKRVDIHHLFLRILFLLQRLLFSSLRRLLLVQLVLHVRRRRVVWHIERAALHIIGKSMRSAINQLIK